MVDKSEIQLKWSNHLSDVASKLHSMLENEILVDASLTSAEGTSIKVHRLILSASSQLFEEIFAQCPPTEPDGSVTIDFKDTSMEDLRAVIQFIYTGEVTVPHAQLPTLLETASFLKIKGLVEQISLELQVLFSSLAPNVTDLTVVIDENPMADNEQHDPSGNSIEGVNLLSNDLSDLDHVDLVSSGEQSANCNQILNNGVGPSYLGKQTNGPIIKPFKCIKCGRAYSNQNNMRRHFLHACGANEPRFKCPHCHYHTNWKFHLKKHLIRIHKFDTFQLAEFDAGKGSSDVGKKTDAPLKPFKCIKCGRAYSTEKNMKAHFLHMCGVDEPRFKCPHCDFRTHWNKSLQKHLIKIHKVDCSQPSAFKGIRAGSKISKFKCDKCQRTFRLKHKLDLHLTEECGVAQQDTELASEGSSDE